MEIKKWTKSKWRKLEISLTDKQIEFYNSFRDKTIKEILVWWWARWWKTRWVIEIIIESCLQYPGIKWLIWRREWDDLRKTTLESLIKALKEKWFNDKKQKKNGEYDMNYQTKTLNFYNWSWIYFVPLKQQPSDQEFNWLGWYEITFFFIDEAQEVNKKVFSILKSRCTEKIKEYNLTWKGILSCNPMKGWLYDRFIKPFKEWLLWLNKIFIQSLYKDNPFINHAEYESSLEDADNVTKERLLKWNWEYDDTPGKLYDYNTILNIFNDNSIYIEDEDYYISIDSAWDWKDRWVIFVWKWFKIIDWFIFEWKIDLINWMGKKVQEFQAKYNIKTDNIVNDHNWIWAWLSNFIWWNIYKFSSQSGEEKKEKDDPKSFNSLRDQVYFELTKHLHKIKVDKKFEQFKDIIIQELDVICQVEIDKQGPFKIISKENIKKLIGHSTDFADAISMRMVFNLLKKKEKAFIYFWSKK